MPAFAARPRSAPNDRTAQIAAGAVTLLAFDAVLVVASVTAPPTPGHLLASDALIRLVGAYVDVGWIPALCAVPGVAWVAWRPPPGAALRRATGGAALGAVMACVGLAALRLVSGPSLPSFIPPEESARPGLVFGLGAGLLEEAAFRFGLLAPAYFALRRRLPERTAIAVAALATGLLFALAHELGPGTPPFDAWHFGIRALVPGAGMSLLFFTPGPAFLVSLHATAHVAMVLLFPGRGA